MVYRDIWKIANKVDTDESCPQITKMQCNHSNVPADTMDKYYTRTVAISFLDKFLMQMSERFDRGNHQGIDAVSAQSLCISELGKYRNICWIDSAVDVLGARFAAILVWRTKASQTITGVSASCCQHVPNVWQLLIIGCVLRKQNAHSQHKMVEGRLTGLEIMSMYFNEALQQDPDIIVESFMHDQPLCMFCKSVLFKWLLIIDYQKWKNDLMFVSIGRLFPQFSLVVGWLTCLTLCFAFFQLLKRVCKCLCVKVLELMEIDFDILDYFWWP